jgi:hypothetical protein
MVFFIPFRLIKSSHVPLLKLEKLVKSFFHIESQINRRRLIGGSDSHVIMVRALGARPPQHSPPSKRHTCLIERLAVLKPYRIPYIADAQDLGERAEHLQQLLDLAAGRVSTRLSCAAVCRCGLRGGFSDRPRIPAPTAGQPGDRRTPTCLAGLEVGSIWGSIDCRCSCSLGKSTQETITRCRRRSRSSAISVQYVNQQRTPC